jgi:lysophospholipase L1-like esterase
MVIVNVPPVPYRVHEKTLPEATRDAFHRRSAAIRSELALRFGISFAHADQVVSAKARVRAGVDMAAGTYTWRLYTFDGLNFNPEGYREMARRLEAPVFLAMRALEAARLEREFTGVR